MATPSLSLSITLLLGGLLLPTTSAVHSDKHSALFTFGDSLYDPGNNNYINTTTDFQANFLPYGESFFTYPTGRFSDGRLIPDFIAEYAKLPLIPAYLKPGDHQFEYGANFASGGAGALVESHQGYVIDLHTQLSYFKDVVKLLRQKLGDKVAKQLLCNAVYLISIGGNDYLARSSIYQSYPTGEYVELVFGNLSTVIKGIYEEGGRKFGFVNMPPLGCLPNTRTPTSGSTGTCMEELTILAKLHNKELPKTLKKLERHLEGFMYSLFDFYTTGLERIENPSKYGFKDGTSACCGSGPLGGVYSCGGMRGIEEYELCDNPREYLFFDSYHPSEAAYQQYAELMWSGTTNVAGSYNLKSLFECTV
ncbi:GDSL esterase/lipase [Actinidia chinensis var. chinensis]|uniref:GDSL esterase/lipase n=1 Tax=Actinidia chinensis var. chinensis TaxID=1590841 RepID=A0A2R6QF80_ACTCC|nr:GDSL esterase/lipase [Actinidia chinensis var. chinensis]